MDLIHVFQKRSENRTMPSIQTGDTVRVHQKITEGEKERVQIFEGLVIKISSGHGTDKTFTVRKITNGVGVEKILPFSLPSIVRLEVIKRGKTRRSKLYYIRDKQQKEARLKEVPLTAEEKEALIYDAEKDAAIAKETEEKLKAEESAKKPIEIEEKEVVPEKAEEKTSSDEKETKE